MSQIEINNLPNSFLKELNIFDKEIENIYAGKKTIIYVDADGDGDADYKYVYKGDRLKSVTYLKPLSE